MTRVYTSLVGAGVVIEAHTGYIVDGHTYSKYCHACTYWSDKVKKDVSFRSKYLQWKSKHDCQKNFSESSVKMESAGAVALWERSLSRKLRYTTVVGDGDSAAYNALCKMNNGDGPYGVDYPVTKEECLNHISKRLGTRLSADKKWKGSDEKQTWWNRKADRQSD